MEETILRQVLLKWNMWKKDINVGIRREQYIQKIYPYMERKEIIVLKGIRRSGKSTIIKQLMRELVKNGIEKTQILLLYLEDYHLKENLSVDLFENALTCYKKQTKNRKKVYMFLDEVQKIDGWETWVRTKYDQEEDIKFIVTGSCASLLAKEYSTLLTGRILSFQIMPLNYTEYLSFSTTKTLKEYLQYGGFPEVVLEQDEEKKKFLLEQYFENVIHKDIIDRYAIRNSQQLFALARYLISTSGAKVSKNKLSHVFGIAKDTIALYIRYMLDAFLLLEVSYFSYSAKIKYDVSKLTKYYATDLGLVFVSNPKYSENKGQMFETAVALKLTEQHSEIYYWYENEGEVDFIAGKSAIQVTATNKIPEREIKSIHLFEKRYKGFTSLIITESKIEENMTSLVRFLQKNGLNNELP